MKCGLYDVRFTSEIESFSERKYYSKRKKQHYLRESSKEKSSKRIKVEGNLRNNKAAPR